MNQVIENIKQRRSIRKYLSKKIPRKVVEELIECAKYAPSSHNRQPWNFTVISNVKSIDRLSARIRLWYDSVIKWGGPLYFIKEVRKSVEEMKKRVASEKDLFFYNAPCIIIIHSRNKRFYVNDCACAAQNIMLAARSLGIGSCWIGFADIALNASKNIRKSIAIPPSHKIMAVLVLGYPEKFPATSLPRKDTPIEFIE
jgi:nitroreductase